MDKTEMKKYKIEWQVVLASGKGAKFYSGENPNCKPIDVPDEFWHSVSNESTDPWNQYNQLKAWAFSGEQLIRNVNLFEAIIDWKPVNP